MNEFLAVKPVLVLGSAIGEVTLTQERKIGGSAFNIARALMHLQVPVINGMPVGNGDWGAAIEAEMEQMGLPVLLRHGQMDNGQCLIQASSNGESVLVIEPGCETQWNKAQLSTLPLTEDTLIYISGEQLVGDNGEALRDWLTRLPFDQRRLIVPGSYVGQLDEDFFAMLSDSHSLLMLNRSETTTLCGTGDVLAAAQGFASAHNLTLICQLDRDGIWLCDGDAPALQIAGGSVEDASPSDARCVGLLAGLSAGWSAPQAVDLANRVAAEWGANPGSVEVPSRQQCFPHV
ncbi:PfkB family carbohydrate kinase [Serratia grimesii]|uniref:PfkB family carbohydrate kinase n=1 Tax=Serratia grimesii TaxID=82995 RepID=UPI002240273C|nr:PfkB family carbohydrate kinase [Serratia grimesii]